VLKPASPSACFQLARLIHAHGRDSLAGMV
jgi:hypothetical protein